MALDSDPSINDLMSPNSSHGSPLFDFLTSFVPRKLKDLFRLCEYLYFNSSQIYAALQKFCTYPITDLVYDTTNDALKQKYKKFHDKTLKTKRILIRGAIDKFVYGNAFFSIYTPFVRFLQCPKCSNLSNIEKTSYKFRLKKLTWTYTCPHCNVQVDGKIVDKKIIRPDKMSVIRWDPKLMDIDYNPVTGHSVYYYTIPKEMKERVSKGNEHLINTLPMEFLKCLKEDKTFVFAEGQIFHMKMDAPAGIEAQWGFPPLASTIKLFFYAAVLRKANEAIALDYVVPLRIISPKQASGNADPVLTISLERWSSEMKTNVKKWRRDPLHIMWSPIPAEVTHLGGQARALMTLGEVQAAEDNIIAALGLPKEFIYGGFSAMGSGIQLRVLENQLLHQTSDLNDLIQWITDKSANLLGWESIGIDLAPFKFIDDVQQKTLLLNLAQTKPNLLSDTSIAEMFEKDLGEEREKQMQEQLDTNRFQQELQQELQKQQNTLAAQVQAQAAAQQQPGLNYDQQQIIAHADTMVQQMAALDPGSRRSQLHQLESEDYVMYSVVSARLKDMQTSTEHEALTATRQQNGMDGAANGAPAEAGVM